MDRNRRSTYSRRPRPAKSSKRTFIIGAVILIAIIGVGFWSFMGRHAATDKVQNQPGHPTNQSGYDKKQYSLDDPSSIWVIVNKPRALKPVDYKPADLVIPSVPLRVPGNESMQVRKEAAGALEKLVTDAKTGGVNLMLSSGYRSYAYQLNLYNGYVKSLGQAEADKTSARPGHSEHQTGLAVDVEPSTQKCELEACFADTPEGTWVAANAYKYGFIIRYTKDKVATTGYEYEPWHLRYVGGSLATELHSQGIETLEEFFDVPGGNY